MKKIFIGLLYLGNSNDNYSVRRKKIKVVDIVLFQKRMEVPELVIMYFMSVMISLISC